jgi:hypothetical protein
LQQERDGQQQSPPPQVYQEQVVRVLERALVLQYFESATKTGGVFVRDVDA